MAADTLPFVHLGARSDASFGESIARVEELCWEAARDEQGYLALTDVNSLAKAPAFSVAAARAGLKPLFGAELDVLPFGEKTWRGTSFRVRLLVEDVTGWRNLVRLVNKARAAESPTRRPAVAFESLLEDHRGLLLFLGGARGEVTQLLAAGNYEKVDDIAATLRGCGLLERSFLELPLLDGTPESVERARTAEAAAHHFKLLPVAIPVVSHASAPDAALFALLHGDQKCDTVGGLLPPVDGRRHLLSRAAMAERYSRFADAMAVSLEVAQHCSKFALPQPDRRFPVHDFRRGVDAESFIWNTVFTRATERYGDLPTRYKERLDREFREIVEAGLANAVVTLTRLTEELENAGVQRGPGGGLFTNSLVASLMGLTRLDPLKFDLPFEIPRNLMAGSFPLLELSVPENQQAQAVEALAKLLEGQVAPVGEWKNWKFTAALEHVASRCGVDAKALGSVQKSPGLAALKEELAAQPATYCPPEDLPLSSPRALLWLALRLEGRLRELALAPSCYTFSVEPMDQAVPQRLLPLEGGMGLPATEWTSEELGVLRHGRIMFNHPPLLDLIGEATAIAREQGDPDYSPESVSIDDAATYRLLREGRTAGITPLESPAVRRRLRQGQPSDLHSFIRLLKTPEGDRGAALDFPTILLCHVCAAIKAHHPVAFLAASLNQASNNPRRIGIMLEEARDRGIHLAALDVNYSSWRWSAEKNALRPGFTVVKGLTVTVSQEILRKRREMHFADLAGLCERTEKRLVRDTHLNALLQAGAFDGWGLPRRTLQRQLGELYPLLRPKAGEGAADPSFFGHDANWWLRQQGHGTEPLPEEADDAEALRAEEVETCGFSLREGEFADEKAFCLGARVRTATKLTLKESGQAATLLGVVGPVEDDVRAPDAVLCDIGGCLVRAVGPLAAQLKDASLAGRRVLVTGVPTRESFQWRMDAEALVPLDAAIARWRAARRVSIEVCHLPDETQRALLVWMKRFPGDARVIVEGLPEKAPWLLRRISHRRVFVCPLLEYGLNRLLGEGGWTLKSQDGSEPETATGIWSLVDRLGLRSLSRFVAM